MIRAFAAIALPEDVRSELVRLQATLPAPRLVPPENLHLTLAFLGDVEEPVLEEVHGAFAGLRAPVFELGLDGAGIFGGGQPRLVFAGVRESAGLRHLHASVERAARMAGAELERRRFVPHVTLCYLKRGAVDRHRLERAVAAGSGFRAGPFPVEAFSLWRSDLGRHGARYTELARYPLSPSPNPMHKP